MSFTTKKRALSSNVSSRVSTEEAGSHHLFFMHPRILMQSLVQSQPFPRKLVFEFPGEKELHVINDNCKMNLDNEGLHIV